MAKNNEAKKYYLSPAAIARLRAESVRSAYPMSVIIDMLILNHLPPIAPPTAQEMAVGMAVRHIDGTGKSTPIPPRDFLAPPPVSEPAAMARQSRHEYPLVNEDHQKPMEKFKIDL